MSFHTDNKLRTVLWGWSDQLLTTEEMCAVRGLTEAGSPELRESITTLLTEYEIDRFYSPRRPTARKGPDARAVGGVASNPVAPVLMLLRF